MRARVFGQIRIQKLRDSARICECLNALVRLIVFIESWSVSLVAAIRPKTLANGAGAAGLTFQSHFSLTFNKEGEIILWISLD